MKITSLVTGGAGFIGSHVVDELIRLDHAVVVLDDLSGGQQTNVSSKATFIEGSITDVDLVNSIFETYSIDYVYHLAAYAAEGLSHFIRRFNYENNLMGSMNLINAAVNHDVRCFVYTSSIAVYGTNTLPMIETATPLPEDPYGIAKYAVELDLKAAKSLFGLNSIVFRPHNVYGSRQNSGDKYRNVVGIFMNQLLSGEALTIFGDGSQQRAFTHIDDVAPYIANSVNVEAALNETFNIGSDDVTNVKSLAIEVGKVMNQSLEIHFLEKREEVQHAYADHSKFKAVFKPKPTVPLAIGLGEMAKWVRTHGATTTEKFTGIEINRNLPPSWK